MTEDLILKNAQYRKAAPIAFLNSRNTAMEMVKMEGMIGVKEKGKKGSNTVSVLQRVKDYTNDLMKDYAEFYVREVASVGAPYQVKDALDKLKKAKDLKSLTTIWQSFSEDERRDGDIIKAVQEIKLKYVKA